MSTPRLVRLLGILLLALNFHPPHSWAGQQEETIETARLLAILLDSGRVTVAKHQDRINAPSQDGAAFTPELFEQEVVAEFQRRTTVDLNRLADAAIPSMAKPMLTQLLKDSIKTIHTFQPVLRLPGMKYKGLIPATFGTETASRFQNYSKIYMKQTAPPQLVRNPKNTPDDYEVGVLERMAASPPTPASDHVFGEIVEGGASARVMLPLYYGKACLACHGEPKGERDIAGYPREGAKLGELGGAISVKIPVP